MPVASTSETFQRGLTDRRRPPIVHFSREARFDRVASNAKGRSVFVDEDMATIKNPAGSTTIKKPVKDFFADMRARPHDWGQWEFGFRQMYEDWKNSHDVTKVNGTHVKNWPLLSPSQVEMLINAGVTTIEAAAEMSDELLERIDGGAFIRAKARYYIRAAEDMGAVANEIATLKADNETLKATNASLGETVAAQRAEIMRLEAMITGKEGFDHIAGRVQPGQLDSVRAAGQPAAVPQAQALESSTSVPAAPARISYAEAQAMGPMELREFCYERNVKPAASAEDTLAALVAVGEIDAPIDADLYTPIADEPEASPPKGKRVRK